MAFNVFTFIVATSLFICVYGTAIAQPYPSRPIRIVASEPGGASNFMARLIAQGISPSLGQPVVVENRAPIIQEERVAKSPPDGYTLLSQSSAFWIRPLLQDVPYNPVKDFSAITAVARSPSILLIHPSLPSRTVKELINLAKNRPGELNYASANTGSAAQLAAELFKSMANVQMTPISYKSAGPALTALLGGEIQLMFATASSGMPYSKSGKLRALAVTSSNPTQLAPDLPSLSDSGLPGYVAETVFHVFAPAKTPRPIIVRLNEEIVRFLTQSETKELILKAGSDVVASSPEELAAMMTSEIERMAKIIKHGGVKTE